MTQPTPPQNENPEMPISGDSQQETDLRKPHILLVEDDDALRGVFRSLLEGEGYEVTELADGVSARAYFEALDQDQPPRIVDCIVTDVRMPGCDGLEMLESIQLHGRHVPTILITGYGSVPTLQRALELGVDSLLDKPVRGADLLREVHRKLNPVTE